MTFDEIRAAIRRDVGAELDADLRSSMEHWVRRSSFERSVQRSLHRRVSDSPSAAVAVVIPTATSSIPLVLESYPTSRKRTRFEKLLQPIPAPLVRLRMREEARARLPKRGVPERGVISISSAGR